MRMRWKANRPALPREYISPFERRQQILARWQVVGGYLLVTALIVAAVVGIGHAVMTNSRPSYGVTPTPESAQKGARPAGYYSALSRSYLAQGDPASAMREAEAAVQADPSNLDSLISLAALNFSQGNKREAWALLDRAAKLAPQAAEPLLVRATFLSKSGQGREAETTLIKAVTLVPSDPRPRAALAGIYENTNRLPEAADQYRAALQLDDTDVENHQKYGSLLSRKGDAAGAAGQVKILASRFPQSGAAELLQALMALDRNNEGEALAFAKKAVAINARLLPAYHIIGTIQGKHKQNADAQKTYAAAMNLGIPDAATYNDFAWFCALTGKELDQAAKVAELARAMSPDNPVVLDTLGWVYFRQGNYERALPLLKDAVRAKGTTPSRKYHYGMALAKPNRPGGAGLLREAVAADPGAEWIADAKAELARGPL